MKKLFLFIGLFYFAGHAAVVKGENYLFPVDAEIKQGAVIPYTTLNVNQVLDNMDFKRVGMKLIIAE